MLYQESKGGWNDNSVSVKSGVGSIQRKLDNTNLISDEDIQKNGLDVAMVDNFELKDKKPIIINTDVSTGQGIHWITLMPFFNDGVCMVIDSLGPNNFRRYDQIMYDRIASYGLKSLFYEGSFQYLDSSQCGFFAIMVAQKLKQMKNPSIEKVVSLLDRLFGKNRSPDDNDLSQILAYFGVSRQ